MIRTHLINIKRYKKTHATSLEGGPPLTDTSSATFTSRCSLTGFSTCTRASSCVETAEIDRKEGTVRRPLGSDATDNRGGIV
jgi:hypothetical protein